MWTFACIFEFLPRTVSSSMFLALFWVKNYLIFVCYEYIWANWFHQKEIIIGINKSIANKGFQNDATGRWAFSQSNERTQKPTQNFKPYLKPGIRCILISIAGLENVGKWDLSANISSWVTTRTFGWSVFNQTGTWPFVNKIIFLIQGAYFWKDLIEYFYSGFRSFLSDLLFTDFFTIVVVS